jgi:DNA polymerase type B, organellar and viral
MYIPEMESIPYIPGKSINHYDVNSLYPYVMKTLKFPVGDIKYFVGDIFKNSEYKYLVTRH